jgi:hypothetical protein
MPQIANILAFDGDSDVTFNGDIPSSGDNVPAKWIAHAEGASFALHPHALFRSRNNGRNTARTMEIAFKCPYENPTSGAIDFFDSRLTVVVPNVIPDTQVTRYVAMLQNFLGDTLIGSSLNSRTAPT